MGFFDFLKKPDHSQVIDEIILEMISKGHQKSKLPFFTIKMACDYGSIRGDSTGAPAPYIADDTTCQFHTYVNGEYYHVEFDKIPDGGTYLEIYHLQTRDQSFESPPG